MLHNSNSEKIGWISFRVKLEDTRTWAPPMNHYNAERADKP